MIASGEKIDLLFSDVVMPEMDGLTLVRLVRAQLPGLPIILTTGFYDQIESVTSIGVIPCSSRSRGSNSKPYSQSNCPYFQSDPR